MDSSSRELSFLPQESPKPKRRAVFIALIISAVIVGGAAYLPAYKKNRALRSMSAEELIKKGSLAYTSGDCKTAVSYFSYILTAQQLSDDHRYNVLMNQGYCEWQLVQNEAALRSFEAALALNPADIQADIYIAAIKRGDRPGTPTFSRSQATPSATPDPASRIQELSKLVFPPVSGREPIAEENFPPEFGVFMLNNARVLTREIVRYAGGQEGYYMRYSAPMSYNDAHKTLLEKSTAGWSLRTGHRIHAASIIERENPNWQVRLVLTAAGPYVTVLELQTIAMK